MTGLLAAITGAVLGTWLLVAPLTGAAMPPEEVPEPLQPWVSWVLHGHEDLACPLATGAGEGRRCAWVSWLDLALDDAGGAFTQAGAVYAESWVTLPGGGHHWPQSVAVDGVDVPVIERDGRPALWLEPGAYRVTGRLAWDRLPEALLVPAEAGLIALSLDGRAVEVPEVEADGRLWLRPAAGRDRDGRPADTLELRVFRRLVDEVPFQVVTRLDLEVSGEPREVVLGPALPPGALPVALEGRLPARLEPDGRLRVQVRPGRWTLALTARFPGPVGELEREALPAPWPEDEVWVLEARPPLRVVEPTGLESLDPRQTTLPADWQELPTFRAPPGGRLTLVERRRGDPDPEPDQLALARTLWLDFDGGGATVQDRISGTMSRGWRLEATPDLELGRVSIDGQDQLITRVQGSDRAGVEVRRGRVDLSADGRLATDPAHPPIPGWGQTFQRVGVTLNLPPGWRLLAVSGADRVRHAWLTRWTLFDLFLVLVVSASVGRLWGWGWGGLALLALGLGYHEPGMPRQAWLYLLAAVALLRVLPAGRLRGTVVLARWASLLVLLVIALPFLVDQVRVGLFPALERPWQVVGEGDRGQAPEPAWADAAGAGEALEALEEADVPGARTRDEPRLRAAPPAAPAPLAKVRPLVEYDPGAAIQTGPGLPRWSWERVEIGFSGPIEADARVRLVLLGPDASLGWRLLTVVLLAALLARVAVPRHGAPAGGGGGVPAVPSAAAAAVLLGLAVLFPGGARADFPPPALLEALRERLLESPRCVPHCAEVPRLRLEASADRLRLHGEVVALADVAVPLPRAPGAWVPGDVLVDGAPAEALARDAAGGLWLRVPAGTHEVLLEGRVAPGRVTLELALPLRPRRVEVEAPGWRVEGLGPDGVPEAALRLGREQTGEEGPGSALAPASLPPLLRVERTLRLGLEWQVETRLRRLSPVGASVVTEVPLLAGEAVLTPGVRVEDGRVLASLAPEEREAVWSSSLEPRAELDLVAPEATDRTELWRLDVGYTWHVEPVGIPPVHREPGERWLPEWRPWPGERLTVRVTRPDGVAAPTLTLDGAGLRVRPGQRALDAELELRLRSSQGGQTALTLPVGARLQSVAIDGVAWPARQEGERLVLPVRPGEQRAHIAWRETRGIGARFDTPEVGLGLPAVNLTLAVEVPESRWVLFTAGPRLGPAVLFWGLLAVIAAAAIGLGRLGLTPLGPLQWGLLGVGLTQVSAEAAVLVVGWLLALGARRRAPADLSPWRFNAMQVGLVILTLAALGLLFEAVRRGLLGLPEMQVAGNGSSGYLLQWYQDRSGPDLPRATVVTAPLWVYRVLMLAWALWLSFALLRWLRWGWDHYRTHGLWRRVVLLPRKPSAPGTEATPETDPGRPDGQVGPEGGPDPDPAGPQGASDTDKAGPDTRPGAVL
jgi:hypothetical protein